MKIIKKKLSKLFNEDIDIITRAFKLSLLQTKNQDYCNRYFDLLLIYISILLTK